MIRLLIKFCQRQGWVIAPEKISNERPMENVTMGGEGIVNDIFYNHLSMT